MTDLKITLTGKLRAALAMVLQALDRDAAEGRVVRGEMAEELRAAMASQSVGVPEPVYMMRRIDQNAWYVTTFQTFEHINSGKSPQHTAVKLYSAAPEGGEV